MYGTLGTFQNSIVAPSSLDQAARATTEPDTGDRVHARQVQRHLEDCGQRRSALGAQLFLEAQICMKLGGRTNWDAAATH